MTTDSPEEALLLLVDTLASGFELLLATIRETVEHEKVLRQRLDFAANEYEKLLAVDDSLSASSTAPSNIVKQLRSYPTIHTNIDSLPAVRQARQAVKLYQMSKKEPNEPEVARCPIAHHSRNLEDFERDFTTSGIQGTLGCPFAKIASGLVSSTQNDPIAAEFHQDNTSTLSPPADQRPGKCPIRFLGQHSPEEVAKYFENHKHEVPRSHEICVRRYGGDESSARQLDAKYGNLVNMIQGLGVKHKAYLPERDRIEERDKSSSPSVEKWAETVHRSATPSVQDDAVEEKPRLSRFEKPLREVRVGESPSRPWGISVPADKEPTPSALQGEEGMVHLNDQSSSSPHIAAATPKDNSPKQEGAAPEQREKVRAPSGRTEHLPQIVFNGPVFFGYSAEDVAALLKGTNLGGVEPRGV